MKTEKDFDYFEIDPDQLREEWLLQVKVFRKHALELAGKRADYERAKARLAVVEAELDYEIRLEPEKFKVGHITEPVVKRTIILQPAHKKAVEDCIKAKHEMDISQADVDTLEQKKRALENAVRLHLSVFWSDPQVGPEAKDSVRDIDIQYLRRHAQKKRGEP